MFLIHKEQAEGLYIDLYLAHVTSLAGEMTKANHVVAPVGTGIGALFANK